MVFVEDDKVMVEDELEKKYGICKRFLKLVEGIVVSIKMRIVNVLVFLRKRIGVKIGIR